MRNSSSIRYDTQRFVNRYWASSRDTMTTTVLATSAADPFSDAALVDPWEIYRELRDVGPVVHLPQYDLHAVMRHADVRAVLGDWETFSSRAVGLNPTFNAMAGGVTTNILMASPPQHHKLRSILGEDLAPRGLRQKLEEFVGERAEKLVDRLVAQGQFDAARDLARPFVMDIVYELNGLPAHGRERFFDWATEMFNALGPANARSEAAFPSIGEMFGWLRDEAGPDAVTPGSWSATIYEAADRGDVPADTAFRMLTTYVAPALDTTIHSLAWAIKLFADHPEQWEEVRADPELIPSAYAEILRIQSPVHHMGRLAEQDTEIDGVPVPEGSRLLVSFASANRDERQWDEPERFDIHRDNRRQAAFGYGVHSCVGQGLARIEGHSILTALASRVERFEVGEGVPFLNNLVHGFDSLPVTCQRKV
ncbi:MAG: cytochrome P450 [Solirubrobacteraceae bacterium]